MDKETVLGQIDFTNFYATELPSLNVNGGGEASALCPFHDDSNPSLSVNVDSGKWFCHAGCGGGDVFTFVSRRYGLNFPEAIEHLAKEGQVNKAMTEVRRVLRAHRWEDAEGHAAYHLRWSSGAKFTWGQDPEGTKAGRGPCKPTLYGLKEVQEAQEVIVVEGEQDADTLNAILNDLGCFPLAVTTCTPNGANDVKREYLDILDGKTTVWVSGDNDDSGQRYRQQCITRLTGRVSQLRELHVPTGYKDWAEWAEGREETQDAFLDLLENAPVVSVLGSKPSPADVADAFLDAKEYRTASGLRLRSYRGEWYRYNGSIFAPIPVEELKADIASFLQGTAARANANAGFVGSVLLNLLPHCLVRSSVILPARWDGSEWLPQPDSIVVRNGVINLQQLFDGRDEVALSDHTPAFVSTVGLPFDFDPTATCPRWMTFLGDVLPDPEARQMLQQIFGYCLTYDTSQQKFFMFEGSGGNGKGVTTDILIRLLGDANVSSLPLESFGGAHDLVTTLGKLVNITSDIGDLDRVAEGLLKAFTGEDMMHFNPKYRPPFSAKPTARLILSTNIRPPFRDRSDGIWRRLIILPFPVTIPKDRINRNLKEELAEELSGIFNWAVEGARSLKERGHFIEPESSRLAKGEFQRESSSARLFLEETCEPDPEGSINTMWLYEKYEVFCTKRHYMPLNEQNFAKEVQRVFPGVTKGRPRAEDRSRPHAYLGIKAKEGTGQEEGLCEPWAD